MKEIEKESINIFFDATQIIRKIFNSLLNAYKDSYKPLKWVVFCVVMSFH